MATQPGDMDSLARKKNDCCGGGGRLRIDLPGVGMVTADEEGDEASISAASRTLSAIAKTPETGGVI